jgi:asparagine synthase (glutamine-hydrolysing)
VQQLLEAPNLTRSTLGSNVTWQLGLLELWLQTQRLG